MTDLASTIAPKSDQLNADDLIAGPMTIRVTRVAGTGTAEQPIAIFFEGDGGKPFKPCKSMRRVLLQIWGKDGTTYPGRSMTIYRDPAVQFGGLAVGGIRISHMSGIDSDVTMALTASRASRKPFTVRPLAAGDQGDPAERWTATYLTKLKTVEGDPEAIEVFAVERAARLEELRGKRPDLAKSIDDALSAARAGASQKGTTP